MDAVAWRQRRRRTVAVMIAIGVLGLAVLAALWLLDVWRTVFALWFVSFAVLHVIGWRARRPRRLLRMLATVEEAVDPDASVGLVQLDERQASGWVGLRSVVTTDVVLVDDAAGYALWSVRRGRAVELMRCLWDAVSTATATDDRGVELTPRDPADLPVRMHLVEFRDERPQRMQTPRRNRDLAARLRARIRAIDPDAAPEPAAGGRDVDWLAPPDRTRPSR